MFASCYGVSAVRSLLNAAAVALVGGGPSYRRRPLTAAAPVRPTDALARCEQGVEALVRARDILQTRYATLESRLIDLDLAIHVSLLAWHQNEDFALSQKAHGKPWSGASVVCMRKRLELQRWLDERIRTRKGLEKLNLLVMRLGTLLLELQNVPAYVQAVRALSAGADALEQHVHTMQALDVDELVDRIETAHEEAAASLDAFGHLGQLMAEGIDESDLERELESLCDNGADAAADDDVIVTSLGARNGGRNTAAVAEDDDDDDEEEEDDPLATPNLLARAPPPPATQVVATQRVMERAA
jgi:hypothetical protein